jgi:hypothetical protein
MWVVALRAVHTCRHPVRIPRGQSERNEMTSCQAALLRPSDLLAPITTHAIAAPTTR